MPEQESTTKVIAVTKPSLNSIVVAVQATMRSPANYREVACVQPTEKNGREQDHQSDAPKEETRRPTQRV
jgi:hypothetical protein